MIYSKRATICIRQNSICLRTSPNKMKNITVKQIAASTNKKEQDNKDIHTKNNKTKQ